MSDLGQQTLESMSQAQWYNQWTMKKIDRFLQGDILEVGCGIGNFTNLLSNYGRVWAIDVKKEYLIATKSRIDGKAQVGIGDIEKGKYFFGNQKFDSIVCLNVLEHINDDKKALKNLFNLLKSGGNLILLIPAHKFLYGEIDKAIGHFRRYGKFEIIKKMKGTGFKINKFRRLNFLGALGWFLAGRLLKEDSVKERNIKMFNLVAPLPLLFEDFIHPPLGTSILIIAQKI